MPGPCIGKNLIPILVTDYIQKGRGQALLFSFEYNMLPNLVSNIKPLYGQGMNDRPDNKNYGHMRLPAAARSLKSTIAFLTINCSTGPKPAPNQPKTSPNLYFFLPTAGLSQKNFSCRLVGWIFFSFWPIYRAFLFTYSSHVGTFIFKENNFAALFKPKVPIIFYYF